MPGISAAGTLARYFSLRFLIAMLAMFAICCVLIFFVDFIEMLRRAGNYDGDVSGFLLAWMTLLRLPSFSELTLPFAVLIGTVGIFLMLSRSSELIVVRAAGVSVWQFMLPAMIVAFLLGIVFVDALQSSRRQRPRRSRAALRQGFRPRRHAAQDQERRRLAARGWRRRPVRPPRVRSSNQGLELTGVTVFQYAPDQTPTERIEARKAILKDGRWELEDAWVSAVGSEPNLYKHYLLSTYLTPTQVRDTLGTEYSISFWDLPNFIEIAERAGLPATQYRVQYQLLLSRPFLLMTMVLIAATCSLRAFRFGNVQLNALGGIAAGFAFFVLAEVSRNFAMAGLTSAMAAAWVPVIIAASLALTVLLYKEDG